MKEHKRITKTVKYFIERNLSNNLLYCPFFGFIYAKFSNFRVIDQLFPVRLYTENYRVYDNQIIDYPFEM